MRIDLCLQGSKFTLFFLQCDHIVFVNQFFDGKYHPVKTFRNFPHLIVGEHFYLLIEISFRYIIDRLIQFPERFGHNI